MSDAGDGTTPDRSDGPEEATGPIDVLIVGGGVAGLTAATFTARAGLETLVVDEGESILRRNAHLENVPGFPAGVNARQFLDLTREQAAESGARFRDGRVVDVETDTGEPAHEVRIETDGGERVQSAAAVVAASWSDASYLDGSGVTLLERGSKTYVETDDRGRTAVDGIYAAGRLAAKAHQTVICAGHGAEVGLAVIEDSDRPYYHDWVAPEGYFTGRGREVPPGCEEIPEAEWEERGRRSRERMREAFAEPHPEDPTMHPSIAAKRSADEDD